MKCVICGIETDSMDDAIDEGWTPYFYEEDKEHGPACPGCSETLITLGDDGEMQISHEYTGKIIYQPEPPEPKEHLVIGIIMRDDPEKNLN